MMRAGIIAAFAGALLACAAAQPTPDARATEVAPAQPAVSITVDNEGFYDADVYLVGNDAIVQRLGTVTGHSQRRLLLVGPRASPGQQLALYARTIGKGETYRSGAVTIFAGLGFKWTLYEHGFESLAPVSETH